MKYFNFKNIFIKKTCLMFKFKKSQRYNTYNDTKVNIKTDIQNLKFKFRSKDLSKRMNFFLKTKLLWNGFNLKSLSMNSSTTSLLIALNYHIIASPYKNVNYFFFKNFNKWNTFNNLLSSHKNHLNGLRCLPLLHLYNSDLIKKSINYIKNKCKFTVFVINSKGNKKIELFYQKLIKKILSFSIFVKNKKNYTCGLSNYNLINQIKLARSGYFYFKKVKNIFTSLNIFNKISVNLNYLNIFDLRNVKLNTMDYNATNSLIILNRNFKNVNKFDINDFLVNNVINVGKNCLFSFYDQLPNTKQFNQNNIFFIKYHDNFFFKPKSNLSINFEYKKFFNLNYYKTKPVEKILNLQKKQQLRSNFAFDTFSKNNRNTVINVLTSTELTLLALQTPLYFKACFNIFDLKNKFTIFSNFFENNLFRFKNKKPEIFFSNLQNNINLNLFLKKKILKTFAYQRFNANVLPCYYQSIVRFLEYCSGRRVFFKINNNLKNALSLVEKARCFGWSLKIKNFRRILGPRLFLDESLQIIYLALKNKDPYFLINWMSKLMYKISFWKYKFLFYYLKYIFRFFFWPIFKELNVKGIKFKLKGKISVSGNARTRTIVQHVGLTGNSTFNNKVISSFHLIKTFTGALGLQIWLIF